MKKSTLFLLALVCFFTSCNGQNSEKGNNKAASSNLVLELDEAKADNQAVFVVVVNDSTDKVEKEKAFTIANGAKGVYKDAVVVELNTSDASNTNYISEWRLKGVPLPLIISLSPKGNFIGGFLLRQATEQKLVDMIPSPKLDEIYQHINNGKAAFVVASKGSNIDKSSIIENCNAAIKALDSKASIVEIDFNDSKEADFLKQLNVNTLANESTTIVINAKGQTTNFFTGSVETTQLVEAAKKVARGCTSTCGTNGC